MPAKWKVFVIMLIAIVLSAIGEALASKGMKQTDSNAGLFAQLGTAIHDWHVWIGTLLMFAYVLLYVYTLSLAELSFALPLSAASYLLGVLLSKYYLHEEIKPARWIGTIVIIAGVLIVAIWGQSSGDAQQKGGQQAQQKPK